MKQQTMIAPHAKALEVASPSEGLAVGGPLWKRCLDILCIVITAPFWVPVMALVAAWIALVSRGPVIFKQERVGLRGRRFTCYKFRTMAADGGTGVHKNHLHTVISGNLPMTKLDRSDRRLIRAAVLLRALGLDELPQLINVLKGEMSLVGPRPCIPYEYEHYEAWHKARFDCLPGLTGLWQVSGKNRTTFVEMVNLDIKYVRNSSLLLDCKIILKTVPALLGQLGAK